ncbi:MAG: DoxX family protein [Reyranella sp.]|jgi:putative oxidoreductase|nr:DoxX family protein [Reyranella sp.]
MSLPRLASIVGRALIALLFIGAGIAKATGPQPFLEHMAAFGVPSFLLPAVIVLEIGAGLALLVGWRVRDAAGALAGFCLIAAVVFHADLANKAERTLFFKDLAIAGGLLAMAAAAEAARRERSVPATKAQAA